MKNTKYDKLINNFISINKKGWNESVCNDTGGVGLTFEKLLDKKSRQYVFSGLLWNRNKMYYQI